VTTLNPLLRKNKVTVGYPLLIWRDRNNQLRVCSCTDAHSYSYILSDFGAHDVVEKGKKTWFSLPINLPRFGSEESATSAPRASSPAGPTASAPQPGTPDYGPDSGTGPSQH